jgi:hypothetical protein
MVRRALVKRARLIAIPLMLALVGLSAVSLAVGREAIVPVTLDADTFTRIEVPAPAANRQPALTPPPLVAQEPFEDFRDPERSFAPRPNPQFDVGPRVIVVPTPTPRPVAPAPAAARSGQRVSGSASWYCLPGTSACHYAYSGGMYAAAGPALRVGAWRGRVVTVCSGGSCVNVKLIDWCQCYGSRVIDLYSDAFRRLAPLSQGTASVTVSW